MAGEHAGHRQRMRERFLCGGLDGFADHEVLELMLFYAIPQRNVNPLAHRLLERFGTLHAVLEAPVADLMKVEGVGQHAALLLNLFSHAARRLEMSREVKGEPIQTRGMAEKHAIRLLQGLKTEHFYIACLDGQMRLIADELIARGSIDEVQAYPRLVAEAVLRHNAHAAVLCHNHPGGSPIPSQQDVDVTRQLVALLTSLGVAVADHIIVSGGESLSMVACGLVTREKREDRLLTRVASSDGETRILAKLMKKRKETQT